MKSILIDSQYTNTQVCILKDGVLEEFWIEKNDNSKIVGNIYKARVVNVLHGMQAAFVDIGRERNAFLYAGDVCENGVMLGNMDTPPEKMSLRNGDIILVQVLKDEFGTKGARVSMNISLPGRVLVMCPLVDHIGISRKILDEEKRLELENFVRIEREGDSGFIVRTEAESCTNDELSKEMLELSARWKSIKQKYITCPQFSVIYSDGDLVTRAVRDMMSIDVDSVIVNNPDVLENIKSEFAYIYSIKPHVFELYTESENIFNKFNLRNQIDAILKRKVVLSNGAYLIVDKTEALTVIDVNTGKYVGEFNLEETVFVTNKIAAIEIARQLKLRNLGGIIIIDFIDMNIDEHKEEIMSILQEEIKNDRVKCSLIGMTELGLVQITRKKMRNMIDNILLQPCPYCKGDAYVYSEEHVVMRIKDYLNQIFLVNPVKSIKIFVNPLVFNKMFALKMLENECAKEWSAKRIYVIPDSTFHVEKFVVEKINTVVIDLPNTAKMLY